MFFRSKNVQEEAEAETFERMVERISEHMSNFDNVDFRGAADKRPLELNIDSNVRFIRLSLQIESSFHLDTVDVFDQNGKNISKGKKTIISSTYQDNDAYSGPGVLQQRRNGGCGFHSKREKNPWLIIDLEKQTQISKIVIYNRGDVYFTRALSLIVEVSTDLKNWNLIHDNWQPIKPLLESASSEQEKALAYAAVFEESNARKVIDNFKKNGEYDQALSFHEAVNSLIKDKGLALGPHGYTKTFDLTDSTRKSLIYAETAKLLAWLNEEFGVPAFISSGTLLGIFRDGKFIGHDDDIDICYISNKSTQKDILAERTKLVDFLKKKGCKLNPSVAAHYWCTMPSGVNIDIFSGFFEEGFCSMNPLKRKGVRKEDVVPVYQQEVEGASLYLPRDPEQLMILNYGPNWRVPDPLWEFDWSNVKSQYEFLFFKG